MGPKHKLASLSEVRILQDQSKDVLAEAERLNGGPGVYYDEDAMFRKINLVFGGFCKMDEDGDVARPLKPGKESWFSVFEKLDANTVSPKEKPFSWLKPRP